MDAPCVSGQQSSHGHNQHGNPSGRDDFIEFITTAPVAGADLELVRVIAENDYVVLHYRMSPAGDEPDIAIVDIWRLENGQIVEHWDVVQSVLQPDQIPNGMF
ncbi:nuclear transport factor 2 family protein [Nocardia africana]|nr:nuclear transport factor 2 family protein [Nocardia africana]